MYNGFIKLLKFAHLQFRMTRFKRGLGKSQKGVRHMPTKKKNLYFVIFTDTGQEKSSVKKISKGMSNFMQYKTRYIVRALEYSALLDGART